MKIAFPFYYLAKGFIFIEACQHQRTNAVKMHDSTTMHEAGGGRLEIVYHLSLRMCFRIQIMSVHSILGNKFSLILLKLKMSHTDTEGVRKEIGCYPVKHHRKTNYKYWWRKWKV